MPIIRTLASHCGEDFEQRVAPILRRAAPLGVRPWLDKRDLADSMGLPLGQQLQRAIFDGPCSSLTLFLSATSANRKWVEQEVLWALERLDGGFRIIPVCLDPVDSLTLPESFQAFMRTRKLIWGDPVANPRFAENYAASVLAAGGLPADTKELTIQLGHRVPQWTAQLPDEWAHAPAIDLRLELEGHASFSPSESEWKEIEQGLEGLRDRFSCLERIQICGQAPTSVGVMIGKVWDRGAGRNGPIELCTYNALSRSIWSTLHSDHDKGEPWKPETAKHVKMERPTPLHHRRMLLAFLPAVSHQKYLVDIERWNAARNAPALVSAATMPHIDSAEQATQVLRECVGIVRFIRETCRRIDLIEIISGYPLALAPLFAHHLRTLGPIDFYDEVKAQHTYRLATTIL